MTIGRKVEENSLKRVFGETRSSEYRPTSHEQPFANHDVSGPTRFVLLTPLELGRTAVARRKVYSPREGQGVEYRTLYQGGEIEETILGAGGTYNYLPAGAEVTAHQIGNVWVAEMNEMWGQISQKIEHDYPVFSCEAAIQNKGDPANKAPRLGPPGSPSTIPVWDTFHVFGTAFHEESEFDDNTPDQVASSRRLIPVTSTWPARAKYRPWDGKYLDVEIPQKIQDTLNLSLSPRNGELWAPDTDFTLSHGFALLDIFWWEWCAPDWVCITFTIPNPDYDPFEDPPDTDPETIQEDHWGIPASSNGGREIDSGVLCSDSPPVRPRAVWRAPVGWWGGLGAWGWRHWWNDGWWDNFGWSTPNYWPAWHDGLFWGPWGSGWWQNKWGGKPPKPGIDFNFDPTVPTPPVGNLFKLERYGWIVWEHGYTVLKADTSNETVLIHGPQKFVSHLVVENEEVPDSACSLVQGGGSGI